MSQLRSTPGQVLGAPPTPMSGVDSGKSLSAQARLLLRERRMLPGLWQEGVCGGACPTPALLGRSWQEDKGLRIE